MWRCLSINKNETSLWILFRVSLVFCFKVNLQVVAEIRPEGQKRRRSDSDSNSGSKEEESYTNKKDLVIQLCRLFNTRGTTLDVEDLTSILQLTKSLMNKSSNNV